MANFWSDRTHNQASVSHAMTKTISVDARYIDCAVLTPTYADASNPQNLGSNVGEVKCMNCHFPHKAATLPNQNPAVDTNTKAGYYLLSLSEEQSCFNTSNRWGQTGITACHGNTGGTPAARNIQFLVDETSGKFYKHRVGDPIATGRHAATEGQNFNNMNG
jgi:hypothetical protein